MRSFDEITYSFVIPVYNERESLFALHHEIQMVTEKLQGVSEIIYVNDGSTDGSDKVLKELHGAQVISFTRNFGKSQALQAGFDEARGAYIFTLDSDLQDDPQEIPRFLEALQDADVVVGWKQKRLDARNRRIASRIANGAVRALTGLRIHDMNCGFKGYRANAAKSLRLFGDMHRYIPAILFGQGFRVSEIVVHHRARQHGKSKYGIGRLVTSPFDFLTFLFLRKFFDRPMHFFGVLGLSIMSIGGIALLYLVGIKIFFGVLIGGRPLLLFGVLFVVVGGQFLSLGLIGELVLRSLPSTDRAYIKKDYEIASGASHNT